MKAAWLIPIISITLILVCTNSPKEVVGTLSETDTAKIYNPDSTPAAGASVRFFVSTDSTRNIVYQTTTDNNGCYTIPSLLKGSYNMIASKDTLLVYQDSVLVLMDKIVIKPDTLQIRGSVTGIISLQPNHDPRTVTVQVLGTDLYSNVDKEGRFTLCPVAKGNYNLRLVTTLSDYTPTYTTIHVKGQKNDTITDALELTYTGIPVVTGLKATYDTLNGVVQLSWNKTDYRDFQNFLVFRDFYNSISLSAKPVTACIDTFFSDTIYKKAAATGLLPLNDSNGYRFKYRICIENNSSRRGETYRFADVIASSPGKVQTSFLFTKLHLAKNFYTDSTSINDTLIYGVNLSNQTRQLKNLIWTDVQTGKVVRTITLDSTKNVASDSLRYAWSSLGIKQLECSVEDMAGSIWKDTTGSIVVRDLPVVKITFSPDTISFLDTVWLHITATNKFGKIAQVEWDIGNTGIFTTMNKTGPADDTFFIAPNYCDSAFPCLVRVTNDDGEVSTIKQLINITLFKLVTKNAGFDLLNRCQGACVFQDKMWLIKGGLVWNSVDGKKWVKVTTVAEFPERDEFSNIVFDNKMWIIGQKPGYKTDVWYSTDCITWKQATDSAGFGIRSGYTTIVFDNKIFVIGGGRFSPGGGLVTFLRDCWYSTDGNIWNVASSNTEFTPRVDLSCFVFDNKIWITGGIMEKPDVWYSMDGVKWIKATDNVPFTSRSYSSCIVYDNKIWIMGGYQINSHEALSDVWYSLNGISWVKAASDGGFGNRRGLSSVVFDNKLWVIGGTWTDTVGNNSTPLGDVWYSKVGVK